MDIIAINGWTDVAGFPNGLAGRRERRGRVKLGWTELMDYAVEGEIRGEMMGIIWLKSRRASEKRYAYKCRYISETKEGKKVECMKNGERRNDGYIRMGYMTPISKKEKKTIMGVKVICAKEYKKVNDPLNQSFNFMKLF